MTSIGSPSATSFTSCVRSSPPQPKIVAPQGVRDSRHVRACGQLILNVVFRTFSALALAFGVALLAFIIGIGLSMYVSEWVGGWASRHGSVLGGRSYRVEQGQTHRRVTAWTMCGLALIIMVPRTQIHAP